jgi:hypothetical protein
MPCFVFQRLHEILKADEEGVYVLAFCNKFGELDSSVRDELGRKIMLAELKGDLDKRFVPLQSSLCMAFKLGYN